MEWGEVGAAIGEGEADEDVIRGGFGIFDADIEIPVLVEDAGLHQLKFPRLPTTSPIFFDEPGIRKRSLRIFIEAPHIGMSGSAIEIVIIFFDVFAVVAFRTRQAE